MESIIIPKSPTPPSYAVIPSSSLESLLHQKNKDLRPRTNSPESLKSSSAFQQPYSRNMTVNPTPPKPPPPPPPKISTVINNNSSIRSNKSSNCNGFRLTDDNCDTGSVYSVYKQKIDQMFDSDTSLNTKNSVQARIDQMFTDAPKQEAPEDDLVGVHSFTVDYLGSVPLNDKITSLAGLQNPLKELYFSYKKVTRARKILTGRLEISSQGLKVQYQGERGDLEQLNSFPTIAVWSAVKFVINDYESSRKSYAFLPLITDPDNIDKRTLFRNFERNDEKYINSDTHSPLFAVVMRKIGVHKQLECHGFVCQTSEDAIVIAATLYKALMSQMKAKEKRPKNRNGVTCMSIASSVYNENKNGLPMRPPRRKRSVTSSVVSEQDTTNLEQTSDTQPLIQTPMKNTPKKSTKTRRAPKAPSENQEDLDAITAYEEPTKSKEEPIQSNKSLNMNSSIRQIDEEIKEVKPPTFSDKINNRMTQEQKLITAEIKQMINGSSSRKGLKGIQSLYMLPAKPDFRPN
ncbi:hypothetical protein WA026_012620 [Henosepilachna vigintioctopunctata]|uniref:PID domain-containing protein n=1 Tax=Henosepilachna vigintioctopunctata TaxID=420089 RepID=A0AAW1U6S3_9CUCU